MLCLTAVNALENGRIKSTILITRDGIRVKEVAPHLVAIDPELGALVEQAQQNPNVAIVVPSKSRVPAPRYSRPASRIIQ